MQGWSRGRGAGELDKMGAGSSVAGGVAAAELGAPLLLLCWLCCWPDAASDSSSSGHPRKPIIASEGRRRAGGSAASLHLAGPSGGSPARAAGAALASYRSHEELSSSAPGLGVLREVLLRRDWDRSSRDLYIPLSAPSPAVGSFPSPAPRATPDTPPDEERRCKKHHSNIKGSRGKEQRAAPEERDQESPSRFYIGDDAADGVKGKPLPPEKDEKQSLNESIRSKGRPRRPPGSARSPDELTPDEIAAPDELTSDDRATPDESTVVYDLSVPDELTAPDRSGAVHHALDSRAGMGSTRVATLSPISVDVVGYEYLSAESPGERRDGCGALPAAAPPAARARHASDGDILAPAPRPESGAFSESDLDLELRLALQAEEQQERAARGARGAGRPNRDVRETAI